MAATAAAPPAPLASPASPSESPKLTELIPLTQTFTEFPTISPNADAVKKRLQFEWKEKPNLLNSHTWDLTPPGLKTVTCGITCGENEWKVKIMFSKLDLQNGFLTLSFHEWETFKQYFDLLDAYFRGDSMPRSEFPIGNIILKFKELCKKPTLLMTDGGGGKFVMYDPVFSRLKQFTRQIDLAARINTRRITVIQMILETEIRMEIDPVLGIDELYNCETDEDLLLYEAPIV